MAAADRETAQSEAVRDRLGGTGASRVPELVRLAVGAPAAVAFGAVAVARRARALHPAGAAFEAVLALDGPDAARVPELGPPGSRRAGVVRYSRGGGLPEGWPDIHGVALRLRSQRGDQDDQDLLLSGSARSVPGRRLLVPTRSFGDLWTSSLTTFRAGGRRVVWAAHLLTGGRHPTVEALRRDPTQAPPIALLVAVPRGRWERVGTVEPGAPVSPEAEDALAFSPWQDGDGIVPLGLLNLVRDTPYRASRVGRRAARPGSA